MIKYSTWIIEIWFERDQRTGKTYELESIKIKTKPLAFKAAKKLAIMEAEKCWPHYELELTEVKWTSG